MNVTGHDLLTGISDPSIIRFEIKELTKGLAKIAAGAFARNRPIKVLFQTNSVE